ncbi:hypothetical protein I7V34_14495 [Bacillus sp. V3]|nr:hypothetical protein I7V34_14495 [Bacillus sp. V3]
MQNDQEKREIQDSLQDVFKDNPYNERMKERWLDEIGKKRRVNSRRWIDLFPGILSIGVALIFFIGFGFFLMQKWDEGDSAKQAQPQKPAEEAPTHSEVIDDRSTDSRDLDKKVSELTSQDHVDINEFLSYFYKELTEGYISYPRGSHDGYFYQSKEEVAEGMLSALNQTKTEDEKLKEDLDRLEVLLEEFLYTSRKFPPSENRPDPANLYYYITGLITDLHEVIVLGGEEDLNGFSLSGDGRHEDVIKQMAGGSRMYPDPEQPLIMTEGDKGDFLPIEAFQIEKTEFTDLSTYVHDLYESYQDGSEYKRGGDGESAESYLIYVSISYINYFKEAIEEKGMTEEFNEWQKAAYEFHRLGADGEENDPGKRAEAKERFEEKMEEVVAEF